MSFGGSVSGSESSSNFPVSGFKVLEEIGQGSYARVVKALDSKTLEVVAIKCVDKNSLSPSGRDNIITEIKVMKLLRHDNIVQMKDFIWDDRYIYIILEFCDGGDLSKFIQKRQKLSENICKKFMQQLALGLQFLRSKNICHWDLKPQNLLLVTKPTLSLKIGDFGFAGFLSTEAVKSTLKGSPLYMAPEILLGHSFWAKSDLWSVGIILYECLFGKAPLSQSTCKQLVIEIKNRTPIEFPSNVPISPEAKDMLQKLLVYDVSKRMDYDEFFSHPFLDIEHFPGDASYIKAVRIAREAVKLDNKRKYKEAFNLYCITLNYLKPFLNDDDPVKRETVRLKISEYIARAETLKTILHDSKEHFVTLPEIKEDFDGVYLDDDSENITRINVKEFKTLCSRTPKLLDAIDIGYAAQMYLYEGNYDVAVEKFKTCLSMIAPLLEEEPEGRRKKLLCKQKEELNRDKNKIINRSEYVSGCSSSFSPIEKGNECLNWTEEE